MNDYTCLFLQAAPTLPLSAFSPLFEVFMGIGFVFYTLTKIDEVMHYILGVKALMDQSFLATIDVNFELTKTLVDTAQSKNQADLGLEILEHESRLIDIKAEIEENKNRIIYNSRFYFLLLGIHAFVLLVFCGIENYCSGNGSGFLPNFYSSLFFANTFFLAGNAYLTLYIFQPSREVPVIAKMMAMVAFFVIAILLGWLVAWHGAVSQVLVLASVFLPVLPFLLLLLRHYHFQAFVGSGKLESEVNLIKQKLQRIMFKVSKM